MNHSGMWLSKEKSLAIEQVKFSSHCWASDTDNGMINVNANIHGIGVLLVTVCPCLFEPVKKNQNPVR